MLVRIGGNEACVLRSESEKQESGSVSSPARREDLRSARDVRVVYERQLSRANELYLEVCSVRLQLEQREKDLQQ